MSTLCVPARNRVAQAPGPSDWTRTSIVAATSSVLIVMPSMNGKLGLLACPVACVATESAQNRRRAKKLLNIETPPMHCLDL